MLLNETNAKMLINARMKLIQKYINKIEELEILKVLLGNDLKKIYQSISCSKFLYNELHNCYMNNDKEHQKKLKLTLEYNLGKHNFKYDFSKIININYGKTYRIPFSYKKKTYEIQFTNPDLINSGEFYNLENGHDCLAISLYYRVSEHSLTLIGHALTGDGLIRMIHKNIIEND